MIKKIILFGMIFTFFCRCKTIANIFNPKVDEAPIMYFCGLSFLMDYGYQNSQMIIYGSYKRFGDTLMMHRNDLYNLRFTCNYSNKVEPTKKENVFITFLEVTKVADANMIKPLIISYFDSVKGDYTLINQNTIQMKKNGTIELYKNAELFPLDLRDNFCFDGDTIYLEFNYPNYTVCLLPIINASIEKQNVRVTNWLSGEKLFKTKRIYSENSNAPCFGYTYRHSESTSNFYEH